MWFGGHGWRPGRRAGAGGPIDGVVVDVVSASSTDGHALAADVAARAGGATASQVLVESRCRHCGGAHGALRVLSLGAGRTDDRPVYASISRASGLLAAAATMLGPIGLDIESSTAMGTAPVDSAAFHPHELAALAALPRRGRARARTLLWTRKEALLKATGHGLRVSPASIRLTGIGGGPVTIADAPGHLLAELDEAGVSVEFHRLDLGDPTVEGSVCVLRTNRAAAAEAASECRSRP